MKRFTETTKWNDPWYRKLPMHLKLLWQYVCDNCDAAGVIDYDADLAAFQIGCSAQKADISKLGDRVARLPSGKYRLVKFLEFQYGNVDAKCPAHKPIIRAIEDHQLEYPISNYGRRVSDRVLNRVSNTLQETETDQDKEKDQEKEKDQGGAGGILTRDNGSTFHAPTLEQVLAYARSAPQIIPGPVAEAYFEDRTKSQWFYRKGENEFPLRGGKAEWQSDLNGYARNWRTIELQRKAQEPKKGGFKATT
jgi:hypothetical protein